MKISVANSRKSAKWKNTDISWKDFTEKVMVTVRTTETVEEYRALPRGAQDDIKDIGGFVGGHLSGGRRKKGHVLARSMLTLDMDYGTTDVWDEVLSALPYALCVYSTHKHTPEKPRLRLCIPLSRDVTEAEYPAVARIVAQEIGIDLFDDTTYEAGRLMYWPSTSKNGEFVYRKNNSECLLNPDTYLARYDDPQDMSTWPVSSRQSEVVRHDVAKQKDPLAKAGVVGAFCRAYSIEDAIETFLPDVYAPSVMEGRYDYKHGESSAGVIVYDGKFAYSHHATDPASGKLLNAFDLVRLHRFRALDDDTAPDTRVTALPSYAAMTELAQTDDRVKLLLADERLARATADFDTAHSDNSWCSQLELDKSGGVKDTLRNITLILENDPNIACIGYNELKSCIDFLSPPAWKPIKYPSWTDTDASQLRNYISQVHGIYSPTKTADAVNVVAARHKHHPIREYLEGLPKWDGIPRVDTLLVDYLGAEDNSYTRAVTRKTLCAAVARVFCPGIKFDSVLVMDGPQDKGKSTLFNRLAGDEWFNDGLTLTDMQDKSGAEKLQGYWILEIGELTGMRKSDIDSVKSFISRRDDKYRASYGRTVESHPRQCVIVATVNSIGGFLRDPTGNRRFWPVSTPGSCTGRHSWDLTPSDVAQIWAEACALWSEGEKLFLEGDELNQARIEQNAALETDPREGQILSYLETLLPNTWNTMDLYARREFLQSPDSPTVQKGTVKRDCVCVMEIWAEALGRDPAQIKKSDSYEITAVLKKLGWVQQETRKRIPIFGLQRLWVK